MQMKSYESPRKVCWKKQRRKRRMLPKFLFFIFSNLEEQNENALRFLIYVVDVDVTFLFFATIPFIRLEPAVSCLSYFRFLLFFSNFHFH